MNKMEIITRLACDWVQRCFGDNVLNNKQERALRLMEETIELAQSVGVSLDKVYALGTHVYARPRGDPNREIGSVLLTAVVMSRTLGWNDPTNPLLAELRRVLDTDVDKFKKRWQEKIEDGVAAE